LLRCFLRSDLAQHRPRRIQAQTQQKSRRTCSPEPNDTWSFESGWQAVARTPVLHRPKLRQRNVNWPIRSAWLGPVPSRVRSLRLKSRNTYDGKLAPVSRDEMVTEFVRACDMPSR